jgi:hypothetical protein
VDLVAGGLAAVDELTSFYHARPDASGSPDDAARAGAFEPARARAEEDLRRRLAAPVIRAAAAIQQDPRAAVRWGMRLSQHIGTVLQRARAEVQHALAVVEAEQARRQVAEHQIARQAGVDLWSS